MASMSQDAPRPTGSLKRKINDPTVSFSRSSSKKAQKHSETDSPRGANGSTSRIVPLQASVEDEPTQDENELEAGPALPSEHESEGDEVEDDEEGRFFGGGVSKEERKVIDYINENEDDQPEEEINLAWLKKTALNFERKINKNAELRAKFENDPMKFVASEADLDAEIKSLTLLSEHPELYKDFVRSGCSDSLVSLLAHDNTDIAIAACEVIEELMDEDSDIPAEEWSLLVKSMLKADLGELLASNLGRLDESNENDSAGVYHFLGILESLLSDAENAEKIGKNTKLLEWLLARVRQEDLDAPNKVSQNRQYAAEILVILAQNHDRNIERLVSLGAVDILLQLLSTWRRRDPDKDSDEEEFAENLFDCLVTLCKTVSGCEKFLSDEGVELCLIMLKEGKFSSKGALRVLDYAASSHVATPVCERLVDAGGLKQMFTAFRSKKTGRESSEHLVSIFASMLRCLPANSAARIRTLAKFVESDYQKSRRLLDIRTEYATRLGKIQREIDEERKLLSQIEAEAVDGDWLARRIDGGLFQFQTLDVVIAWLIAEDEGARSFFSAQAAGGHGPKIDAIRATLQEQVEGLDLEAGSEAIETRDVLEALIRSL